ncbi:MAG: NAD(P)H-dependent oxidoreductase [Pseudomonadota bacterium]
MTKIIIIPGSSREGSFNRKLASSIAKSIESHGATATEVNLSDYPMPIFNEDWESENGAPAEAKALAQLIAEHQGVVFVTPEYNASLPPLLKNTIDWLSRGVGVKVYQDRVFALAACSPGGLGGIRCLSHLRDVLLNVGAEMITPQIAVGQANTAFNEDMTLSNERTAGMLDGLSATLVGRIKSASAT